MTPNATDIINVISTALHVEPSTLGLTTPSTEIPEWDSLGHLRVCLALEEHFGVEIDMERMADLTSVAQVVSYIESHR